MRLISNFKDYYDFGLCYGVDPKLCFERLKRDIPLAQYDKFSPVFPPRILGRNEGMEYSFGFCGKLYSFLQVPDVDKPIWNIEEYLRHKELNEWMINRFKEFFTVKYIDDKYFIIADSPIFLIERGGVIEVNPTLKTIGFQYIMNGTECFNAIAHYIGNVLNKSPEMVKVSDKERIRKAGFNEKSFKHPVK